MPICWSHTAPTVTQEEFEAEKRALSEEQKRQIEDEIYGSYEPILETPKLIAEKINQMNQHLDDIPQDEKGAYLDAKEKCPEYCNNDDFRLMFLRADKFDAEKAAHHFVSFWEEKLNLFGPNQTYHRMSIDDLLSNPKDVELMESGAMYPLPEKDAAGRGILFVNRTKLILPQFDRKSKLRLLFYILHCLFENDDITQKKGFVLLIAPPENVAVVQNFDRKFVKLALKFDQAFPCRIAAYHTAVPSLSFVSSFFLPVLYFLLGSDRRNRFIAHRFQQSPRETAKNLERYGIQNSLLPIELGGVIIFEYDAWLEQRRKIEQARTY